MRAPGSTHRSVPDVPSKKPREAHQRLFSAGDKRWHSAALRPPLIIFQPSEDEAANLGCSRCALLLEVGGAEAPKTHPRPLSGKLVEKHAGRQRPCFTGMTF